MYNLFKTYLPTYCILIASDWYNILLELDKIIFVAWTGGEVFQCYCIWFKSITIYDTENLENENRKKNPLEPYFILHIYGMTIQFYVRMITKLNSAISTMSIHYK